MTVKPAAIIQYARNEIIHRNQIAYEILLRYKDLFGRFQRVRWNMARLCLNQQDISLSKSKWYEWLNTPIQSEDSIVSYQSIFAYSKNFKTALAEGVVDDSFPLIWKELSTALYPRLLDEIDSLLGFSE